MGCVVKKHHCEIIVFFIPGSYENWRDGEPTRGEGEDCVAMGLDGTWSDEVCNVQRRGVIKLSKSQAKLVKNDLLSGQNS